MTGKVILPLVLDPRYATDIDGLVEWQFAEWLIRQGTLPMVRPNRGPEAEGGEGLRRKIPERCPVLSGRLLSDGLRHYGLMEQTPI